MNNNINMLEKTTAIAIMILTCQPVFAIEAGEVIGKHIFGLAHDYQNDPVVIDNDPLIYKNEIDNSKIQIDGSTFEVSLFDNDIGAVYVTKFDNNTNKYLNTNSLDLSPTQGVSRPVGAILTNWNSVLFSEATLADSAKNNQFADIFKPYYKNQEAMVNPYNYGWINELVVFDKDGNSKVIKNYAMGRVSASQILPMPDDRTFYLLDANHSGNVYVFVADKAKTMTRGVLYTMFQQDGSTKYFNMGEASALKMKFRLNQVKFDEVFRFTEPSNRTCPASYSFIDTVLGEECLQVRSKYKKYVGKFEPIRFSAISGIKPYADDIRSISLDKTSNNLTFMTNNGNKITLPLAHNASMSSDYIAEILK